MKRVGDVVYQTKQWRKARNAYYREQHGICERCGEPGDVVHHIEHLTAENVNDPVVAYAHENLELLCHDCHNRHHKERHSAIREDVQFDSEGNLIPVTPPF